MIRRVKHLFTYLFSSTLQKCSRINGEKIELITVNKYPKYEIGCYTVL